ncbi:MAG: protein kinase [Vulcanimicrobiota bacterium]
MSSEDVRNHDEDEVNTPDLQSRVGSENRTLDVRSEAGGEDQALRSRVGSEDRTLDVRSEAGGEDQALRSRVGSEDRTLAKDDRESAVPEGGWGPGKVIDGLYLVKRIMEGGMGRLYFVRHLRWGVTLVVKSPLEKGSNDQMLHRFLREADAWVDLDKHPNIATAFYVREYEGIPRIFIEYVDGGSLAQWLKGNEKGELDSILDKALQCCEAMIHAHKKGMVHRDIKPDNVLLTSDGIVKVTDFGLVKTHTASTHDAKEQAGGGGAVEKPAFISQKEWQTMASARALGTPPYMPPEQWTAADEADSRADIYSFGVMLFEMICGRRPFEIESDSSLSPVVAFQVMHRFNAPPRPSLFRKDIPEELERLILGCLEKEREKRPQSFGEVRSALLSIYAAYTGKPYRRRFTGAAELRSDDLNNRALSYIDLGRYDDAMKLFQQAIALDPLSVAANVNLILHSVERGTHSYDDVKKRFKAITDGNREDPVPLYYEAIYEYEWGSPESALPLIEAALKKSPPQAALHNFHGIVLRALNRLEEAQSAFARSFSLEKEKNDYLHNYGMALHERGLFKESAAAFAEGARREQQEAMWLESLALSCAGAGNMEQAGKYLVHCIRKNPPRLRALMAFGEISLKANPKEAIKAFERARTLAPHLPSLTDRYNECCVKLSLPVSSGTLTFPADPALITAGERDLLVPVPGAVLKPEREGGKLQKVALIGYNGAVSIDSDSLLELWDLSSGSLVRGISDQDSHFKSEGLALSISPDGRFIATAHSDRMVRIWEVSRGLCRARLSGHENMVRAVAFSPDGSLLASAGVGGVVIVRKIPGFEHHKSLDTHSRNIYALSFLPDNDHLALTTHESEVQIWSIKTGGLITRLKGHQNAVLAASVSPDGLFLFTGGEDGCIKLWDIRKGLCIKSLSCGKSSVEALAVSSWGCSFAAGMGDGSVRLWDAAHGICRRRLPLHEAPVTGLVYSEDGRRLVSTGRDGRLCIIPLPPAGDSLFQPLHRKEFVISRPRTTEESISDTLAFQKLLQEGNIQLDSGCIERAYRIYRQALEIPGHEKDRRALAAIARTGRNGVRAGVENLWQRSEYKDYSGSGTISTGGLEDLLAYPGREGLLCLRRLDSGETECITASSQGEGINSICMAFDGETLLSGTAQGLVELRQIIETEGHSSSPGPVETSITADHRFSSLALFPGNRYCASGGSTVVDSTIKIWELGTGKCLRSFPGHANGVEALSLSRDGRKLLSGGADRSVRLWDTKTGSLRAEMEGHTLAVTCCSISPDGLKAASGSKDGTIRLWDLASFSTAAVASSQGKAVASLAFSPDSRFLLSGYRDGTVAIVNADTLAEVRILGKHPSHVTSVAFSGNGRFITSASGDGRLIIWEIDWEWDFSTPVSPDASEDIEAITIEEKEHFVAASPETDRPAPHPAFSLLRNWLPIAAAVVLVLLLIRIPSCIHSMRQKEARSTLTTMFTFYMDVEKFKSFGKGEDILFSHGEAAADALLERSLESRDSAEKLMCLVRLDNFIKTRSAYRDYIRKKAPGPLCRLLSAPEPAVRGKAANLLGELKITEARKDLNAAMESEKNRIDAAASIIGRGEYNCSACHGDTRTKLELPVCGKKSRKSNDYVLSEIEEALKKL